MIETKKDISYVLITPARNEDRTIGNTINSVINQTLLPKKMGNCE